MFRVEWIQDALDDMMRIWMAANSTCRQEITRASNQLDAVLKHDPVGNSESRREDERVLFIYPLAATIEIDVAKRVVWVLNVWCFRRRATDNGKS